MNAGLLKWFQRVSRLFKVYLSVALIAVALTLAYGFITGPLANISLPSPGFIFGAIVVIVVVYTLVNFRSKAGGV